MSKFKSDINYLRQYVNGELSPAEMYEIERAMHEDEMLMDIIEGLETEKTLQSPSPTSNLHRKISKKVSEMRKSSYAPIKTLLFAASVIGILGIGAFYIFTPPKSTIEYAKKDFPADEKKSQEIQIKEKEQVDTSLIASSAKIKTRELSPVNIVKAPTKRISKRDSSKLPRLATYPAKSKLDVIIENPKYLGYEDDYLVLSDKNQWNRQKSETVMIRGINSYHTRQTTAEAKTQSDVQKEEIDPQIKVNLNAGVNKQTENNKSIGKEKQAESSISEILSNSNTLANKKINEMTSTIETYESIPVKTLQNGNPINGWTTFNAYMRNELKQKGFTSYNVNISFDLDERMLPKNIEIKSSSNAKINKLVKDLLRKGPTWENKDPNHPIFIRINSEETTY